MDDILFKRSRIVKQGEPKKGPVVYWMSREQRVNHNWALIFAAEFAKEQNTQLIVIFCMVPSFLEATIRQYSFMVKGLQQVESNLKALNIPFHLLMGSPELEITEFCKLHNASGLVTDFDPLRIKRQWKKGIADKLQCTIFTVDAHNIVPAFVASDKAEFGAYTLRPKIKKLLPVFLGDYPELEFYKGNKGISFPSVDWKAANSSLKIDYSIQEVDWCFPGESEARDVLNSFISCRLDKYETLRNDPVKDATSGLSPYLHFGQLSSQFVAQQVIKINGNSPSVEAFLEELIIRKELSDNFCLYNPNYDSFDGFPAWAQKTLNDHRVDEREFLYYASELEGAKTHDSLWNAAQLEMVLNGKMHGYMRMYWAKKILEWTSSPEEALRIAVYLNDKYELDGRDPNGYVGCAWAIGGVHDRAWSKRPVFGMIRYMNYNGCRRKFDVDAYKNMRTIASFQKK